MRGLYFHFLVFYLSRVLLQVGHVTDDFYFRT
jgi:hypothetical protein